MILGCGGMSLCDTDSFRPNNHINIVAVSGDSEVDRETAGQFSSYRAVRTIRGDEGRAYNDRWREIDERWLISNP